MTKEELEKEAEKKYCNGCKWRIEQCLWAWRNTNGLNEPNEKNCSCKEVPAYIASAEPREKRIAELEKENKDIQQSCENYYNEMRSYKNKIAELEDKLANADYQLEGRDNEIRKLEKENKVLTQNLEDTEIINKALEKENAELKNQLNKVCGIKGCMQLTKAKELLKEFNLVLKERGLYHNGLYKRIEQFLKDNEVEK